MQPCQRRTIGGSEGRGRWTGDPRHPSAPPPPPLSLLGSPSHPIPSVRRDCTARGRYWGAYGSAQGDAPVRLSTPSLLSLSIYLFQSTLARDYIHALTDTRSLSLSAAVIIRLCPPCRHIRRVYDSVPLVPADACPPLLHTTPLQPCTVRSARSFAAFREKRETVYGRRVTRETWRNWQEGITDIGQRRIAMGYLLCPPTSSRIPASLAARIGRISHLDD